MKIPKLKRKTNDGTKRQWKWRQLETAVKTTGRPMMNENINQIILWRTIIVSKASGRKPMKPEEAGENTWLMKMMKPLLDIVHDDDVDSILINMTSYWRTLWRYWKWIIVDEENN